MKEASALILSYGDQFSIRTLDAIQLSAFLSINEDDWVFVSNDSNLLKFAEHLGPEFKRQVQRRLLEAS